MSHYTCEGDCGGASTEPKVCGADGCQKHGEPMAQCTCGNDSHAVPSVTHEESSEGGE